MRPLGKTHVAEGRRHYTTGEVALICMVSVKLVNKWVDSGKLKGYRIPGGGHRRVTQEALSRFLKENNMPMTIKEVNSHG